ncbi:MAG TPA: histone deacetylase [Thermoanaerobaculia bacterium]|nr:histone deacetylase [Thermoanaerobaculia bacterium]
MTTGLVSDDRFLLHKAPYDHPEHPGRLLAVRAGLEREGLVRFCRRVPARPATDDELTAVHTPDHVWKIDATAGSPFTQLDPDTYACADSAAAARLAAGGLVDLTLGTLSGQWDNGFALLRPPGHHAEADAAMGFCLFNNVAIAAKAALSAGARRVLIVDWDLHHGNGTQNTFWNDPRVVYFSTHEWPLYPGTGASDETGGEDARGRTINLPWPPGMGDAEYLAAFDEILMPIARQYEPDLVIVSCGFDAALGDLLGQMRISPDGYAQMTSRLLPLAGGRIVLALEGGYRLDAIAQSAAACVKVLQGEEPLPETLPTPNPLARRAIERTRSLHAPFWEGL